MITIYNKIFHEDRKPGLFFYESEDTNDLLNREILDCKELIVSLNNSLLHLYPNVSVLQRIFFCTEQFYVYRFTQKLKKAGVEPTPFLDWSEGDTEIISGLGEVLFIRVGASFHSKADKMRFFCHELAHVFAGEVSPILRGEHKEKIFSVTEGLIEADARVALGLQYRDDMTFSQEFLLKLDRHQLALPLQLDEEDCKHKSFLNKTVSLNPGYASCFLWFFGMATFASKDFTESPDTVKRYLYGRSKILEISSKSATKQDFKLLLKSQLGFDYEREANNIDFLLRSREILFSR